MSKQELEQVVSKLLEQEPQASDIDFGAPLVWKRKALAALEVVADEKGYIVNRAVDEEWYLDTHFGFVPLQQLRDVDIDKWLDKQPDSFFRQVAGELVDTMIRHKRHRERER